MEIRTAEQIESLKTNWMKDPCWDIEDTEEFEAHRDELMAWRLEYEAKAAKSRAERLKKRAEQNRISVDAQASSERYETISEQRRTKAQELLMHYLKLAGVQVDFDNASEIESIVDEIVMASAALVMSELAKKEIVI